MTGVCLCVTDISINTIRLPDKVVNTYEGDHRGSPFKVLHGKI